MRGKGKAGGVVLLGCLAVTACIGPGWLLLLPPLAFVWLALPLLTKGERKARE